MADFDVFPYQDEGGSVLASKDRFGLHDEMGVGKTATVWNAVEKIGAERGIIVCPAMLRENWIGERRKFYDTPLKLCKGQNIHDFTAWKKGRFNILVTSYELATKWAPEIWKMGEMLDFVAFDEAHYMKNSNTARTKALLGPRADGHSGMVEWAQRVWHVTGTPMANDPKDIFTFLSLCHAWDRSEDQFVKRYFHKVMTRFGSRQEPKPEMVPELQALIQNNSIRRTKTGVGMQLPPIFMTTTLVDGDTAEVTSMLKEYPGIERAILAAVDQGGLSFLDAQHIMTLRRLIGEAKAVPYGYMLLDEIMSGATDKRVVYGVHKEALKSLQTFLLAHGIKAVIVNGDTPEKLRIQAVHDFQNDPETIVFIGNIRAAGTGLTLTAACEIDMLESDWSPAGNAQAIMRIHRIGQQRNVRARFITLAKSLDEVVNRIVAQKTAAIASIEGDAMHAAPLDVLAQFT